MARFWRIISLVDSFSPVMQLWMRNPDCNTFQHLCHWIMILVSPNFCRTSILLRQISYKHTFVSNKFVHHVRLLLLVLFEFAFAFAYRYQQRNGCPISLFLCKIIASATFGCRRSFKTADSCSTASCIFLFTEGKIEDPFLKIRGKECGEWLAPPPVVAVNLKTFLHKTCSTQFTICWQLALSFRKY